MSLAADRQFLVLLVSGTTVVNSVGSPLDDLRGMLEAVDLTAESRPFWAASPAIAIRLATIGGATAVASPPVQTGLRLFPDAQPTGVSSLLGYPLVVSGAVPSNRLWLLDAARIAAAADPVELAVSEQASIEMSDTPTMAATGPGSPDAPVGSSGAFISAFQANASVARAIAYIGASVLSGTPAVALESISW